MPSFDIVSQVDMQRVDDAVNNTHKQIATRYDLRGSTAEITLDRKARQITLLAGDTMKLEALRSMFMTNASKRGIDLKSLRHGEPEPAAGGTVRLHVDLKEGLEKEETKHIVQLVKDMKLKVQPSIQGDEVRVTGKKIDDLQAVMAMLRGAGLDVPVQFVNMRS